MTVDTDKGQRKLSSISGIIKTPNEVILNGVSSLQTFRKLLNQYQNTSKLFWLNLGLWLSCVHLREKGSDVQCCKKVFASILVLFFSFSIFMEAKWHWFLFSGVFRIQTGTQTLASENSLTSSTARPESLLSFSCLYSVKQKTYK